VLRIRIRWKNRWFRSWLLQTQGGGVAVAMWSSSRCRGNAWAWIEPSIKEGKSVYSTWDTFKTAISRAFGEADSNEVARRKFKIIRQGARSAAAYWAEFQRIKSDLKYNDKTYIDQFSDGLNTDVQRQLALLDE
jgi:hypothetical protein